MLFGAYDARDGKWLFHATDVFSVTGDTVINELPAIEPYAETFPARMPISLFAQRIHILYMRLRDATAMAKALATFRADSYSS